MKKKTGPKKKPKDKKHAPITIYETIEDIKAKGGSSNVRIATANVRQKMKLKFDEL